MVDEERQLSLPIGPPRAVWRGSTWLKPVPGQPGLYASSHGRIWSTRGGVWRRLKFRRGGCKKGDKRGGYYVLHFRDYTQPKPKPRKAVSVHILVCCAWHGPKPADNYEVDHINDNHLDNRPDNLKWLPGHINNAKRFSGGMTSDEDWEDVL